MKRTNYLNPAYYLYQKDGQWFKTNENTTSDITRALQYHTGEGMPRTVLYPQFDKPEHSGERVLAWRVNEYGDMVVRNAWRSCEHRRGHSGCRPIGDGQCVVKVACELEWSEKYGRWILAEMPCLASTSDLVKAGVKP